MIEISGHFGTEPNLQTVRVRFQGTIEGIAPSSIKFYEESGIGYLTFRVPSDAESGPVEIFSENHAPGNVQSTLEVLPEMPPLQQGAWVSRADLGWGKLEWVTGACTFTIGSKAYIVGGASIGVFGGEDLGTTNLWEYDPAYNAWRPLASFPAGNLSYAVAFSINGVGYVGTGRDKDGNGRRDFHAYDPETDSWERKADLPGEGRVHAVGFATSGNGYIGSGINDEQALDDFYKYSPISDSWSAIQPNPSARTKAYSFVIDGKGFVGGGTNSNRLYDLHMLDTETDTWILKKGWVGDSGGINHVFTSGAATFTIGESAYVGLGYDHRNSIPFFSTQAVVKYSIKTDSWEYFIPFEGSSRTHAIGFAVDGVGYFGLGRAIWLNNTYRDVWV